MNSPEDFRSAAGESLARAVAELDQVLALIGGESDLVPAILSARSFIELARDKLGSNRPTEVLPRPTLQVVALAKTTVTKPED